MDFTRWIIGGNMPLPRAGCAVGICRDKVIVAGGTHWVADTKFWVDRCDQLDPKTGEWESLPPLPRAVGDGAAVVIGDKFYLAGGGVEGPGTTDVWCFDGHTWAAGLAPLPERRRSLTAVAHEGDVVLLGGLAGRHTDYASATSTVWRSSPAGWRVLAPMPGPARVGYAAGVLGGRLVVAGGCSASANGVRNLDEVLAYDFASDQWTRIGTLPQARRGITGLALPQTGLLAFGGYSEAFSAEILAINPATGAVTVMGSLPKPVADARFVLSGGRLVGVSGEDGMKLRWADWVRSEMLG